MSSNEHVRAIHYRAEWIRSRYSGHTTLGELANDLDSDADALAAKLAEAEARAEKFRNWGVRLETDIHQCQGWHLMTLPTRREFGITSAMLDGDLPTDGGDQ